MAYEELPPPAMRAPAAENQSPEYEMPWPEPRSKRSSTSSASVNSRKRSYRSREVSSPWPSTYASNPVPPDPSPSTTRPPATWSSVATSFANGTGCR